MCCGTMTGSGLPCELLRSIENAFVDRRPHGTKGNSHTLAPRGSNALRKCLLEMAQTDLIRRSSTTRVMSKILRNKTHGVREQSQVNTSIV
jgi:hypothetical protein